MKIRYRIYFRIRPYGKNKSLSQIQLRVTYNNRRLIFSTGCALDSADYWDDESQCVVPGYRGSRGETDQSINDELRVQKEQMQLTFQYFEVNDVTPSPTQVTEKYFERRGIKKTVKEGTTTVRAKSSKFFDVYQAFIDECGQKNAWTEATYEKMAALKEDLLRFRKNVDFADLDEAGLTDFVRYLRDVKVLRTPRKKKDERPKDDKESTIGLRNSSIKKKLDFLRWFLNWATDRGYNDNLAYKSFRPTLKATQKKVIFLSKAELEQLKQFEIPADKHHYEYVRDVFMFCCFSGLRYSDVCNLKRLDVKEDHIEVTTVKTADSLSIELNDITRGILEKYKDEPFPDNRVLPVLSTQAMNRELKELCKLVGINEQIRVTTYKGNQRKDEIKEKWEMVGTHTGRRTFIVTCLSLGIPPNIVMKWTGHSDYKSMKPYIDIVDSIKASEMTKLNNVI